jgi:hypothetical protein
MRRIFNHQHRKYLYAVVIVAFVAALLAFVAARFASNRMSGGGTPAVPAVGDAGTASGIEVSTPTAAASSSSPLPPLTTIFPKDDNRFSISTHATTGPLLQEGYLIPFYPAVGDTQTMSIKASDSVDIASVLVTINTDKKSATYPLKLAEGDAMHGLWKGSWKVSDTHDNVYTIIIYAADKMSSSSVQITLK